MSRLKMNSIRAVVLGAAFWLAFGGVALHAQQAAVAPSKVAVIDVRRILTESDVGRVALEALGKMAEEERTKLETLDTAIQTMEAQLEAGRLSLSIEKQSEMEAEIQEQKIDFRRAQDDARKRIEDSQGDRFGEIESRVMPLIAEIGEEQGITLIFNKFEDSGLLWAQDGADITALVLERFNALPEL